MLFNLRRNFCHTAYFTTVYNLYRHSGLTTIRPSSLHGLNNLLASLNTTKHNMLVIQPRCLRQSNEELTAICVGACIGHAQQELFCVQHHAVIELIVEALAVDTFPSSAISSRKIT
jgi:hypothetical protein